MNRLSHERSAYLRHAAHQKIDWHPWSDEAFEKAEKENKPVFLSSGAVWCHWCHVMAKECFENDEIAALLNEKYIAIKLDRDERPDIDRRYQRAVSAMGNGGGWPLSVFLTPDKKAFFGGTYFPPEDSHGRPGFGKVLKSVYDFYRSKKEDIAEYTSRLTEHLAPASWPGGVFSEQLIKNAEESIACEYDPQNGGFGTSPKFPMPGALEFLLNRHYFTGKEALADIVKKTIDSMAKGGFHDQLGGGFHRYSVDEAWIVPHFEKMADDNSWLLRNYLDAYALFGDERYRMVAEGIIGFFREVLSSPEGGFYSSQDADVTPDDEGGYFTWSDEEFRKALTGDEYAGDEGSNEDYRVMSLYFLDEGGVMHHDKNKRVLIAAMTPDEISAQTGLDIKNVMRTIQTGREKLLSFREERTAPFIDTTLYTSLNGLCVTAFLHAYRILGNMEYRDYAITSLKKILKEHYADDRLLHTQGVPAMLDDYIFIIEALVSAYELTGDRSYLDMADELMNICIDRFLDKESGGFFDTDDELLGLRLKSSEDIPHPSANSVGIIQLLKLHNMTGKDEYRRYAEAALKFFAPKAQDIGVHSGYYACAADAYFRMLNVKVEAVAGTELADEAVRIFRPYKSIVYGDDKRCVIPCINTTCYEPLKTVEEMREFFDRQRIR